MQMWNYNPSAETIFIHLVVIIVPAYETRRPKHANRKSEGLKT